jgi:hypothetical protein
VAAALANLSDVEFEELVADLLRAETGKNHRVFRRAADGGIDVRRQDDAVVEVAQCKHYLNSTFEWVGGLQHFVVERSGAAFL